jgi:hypothetical protein
MKRFIFLILSAGALMASLAGSAQIGNSAALPLKAGDTTVNTGTASRVLSATGNYAGAVIQVKVTKISGTAAGTVKMQGSLDGTNYEDIGTAYTVTDVATQFKTFYISAPLPQYIRVLETGAGTMSAVYTIRYLYVKYSTN